MAMHRYQLLYQLVLGDFRERTRRYSYLLTMLGALFFGYLVITGKYTVQFSDYRSIYNSEWFGTMMAVTCGMMFSIAGFYLVKNSISRDRRTQVGQIIASTPLSNLEYIFAKFVSNFLVLLSMVAVLAVIAFLMLLFRNESGSVDLWAFSLPFLLLSLPAMALVAAAAVFFDTVKWLRGSLGNVLYLFMAEIFLVMGMMRTISLDLAGNNLFIEGVKAGLAEAYPGVKVGLQMGFIGLVEDIRMEGTNTFVWKGIDWSPETVSLRFVWIGLAIVVLLLTLPFFDRFDPAGLKQPAKRKKAVLPKVENVGNEQISNIVSSYSQISVVDAAFSFVAMIRAEFSLMVKGFHWSWYLIAAGILAAQLVVPFDIARMYITPLAMVWPLLIWSAMGNRETRFGTGELLFSSPMPFKRQFPSVWLAGLFVALAAVGTMVMRSIIAGQWSYAMALLIGAFFVSSLALAFGTISGSKKLFEVIYLMFWYVGSVDHVPVLDLLGTTAEAVTITKMLVLGLLTVGLLTAAGMARRRQVYGC